MPECPALIRLSDYGDSFSAVKKNNASLLFLLYFGFPDWLRHSMITLLLGNSSQINENIYNYYGKRLEKIDFEQAYASFTDLVENQKIDFSSGKFIQKSQMKQNFFVTGNLSTDRLIYDICKITLKNESVVSEKYPKKKKFIVKP